MTIKLTEIIDYVMLETGQFIVGDISNINIDKNRFWLIVKRALKYQDKYKPISKRESVYTQNGTYVYNPEFAPEFITSVYPIGLSNPFTYMFDNDPLAQRTTIVFRYVKPVLTVTSAFQVEVLAHYHRNYTIEYDSVDTSKIVDVDIENIDVDDTAFMDMVKGYFLVALGKSRRAFTISDFPVTSDAQEMIAEGQSLIDDAKDSLQERGSWWIGIGG